MIIAGTVSAYLKLSIDDFRNNLLSAIDLLSRLTPAGAGGASALDLIRSSASGAALALSGSFSSSVTAAGGSLDGLSAHAVSAASSVSAAAVSMAGGIRQGVLSPIQGLRAPLTSAMMEAGNGMAAGLRSKTASIISAARSIANQVTYTIRSALKIASPSKVMRGLGEYAVEGLALGMDSMLPRVAHSAAAVAQTVTNGSAVRISAGTALSASGASIAPNPAQTQAEQPDLSALSERMDRLLDYLYDTEPVLRLDGRTFARMVREYS